ncbi:MAG: hypothetical protein AB3X44_18320 [Leptothrix sp. (in: b-proteobacteria)]
MKSKAMRKIWTTILLLAWAAVAAAEPEGGLRTTGSGFLTIAAGKIIGGRDAPAGELGYRCQCFIADYAQGGIYEPGSWQLDADSKLGLQGTIGTEDDRYRLTGQIVSRGAHRGKVDLEWLYGTAELDSRFTLQLGRKRLPLLTYSEVQDVGVAIPWVHLSPPVYGWEIVNYNGANLSYRDRWGDWFASANVFAGSETVHDSDYEKLFYGLDAQVDVRWSDVVGGELKLSRDIYEIRMVRIQAHDSYRFVSSGETAFSDPKRLSISGLSLSADPDNWLLRAEFLSIRRDHHYSGDYSDLVAAGYRLGAWTPVLSWSRYRQKMNPGAGPAEAFDVGTLVLRYDFAGGAAVKLQYDSWHDRSQSGHSTGDHQLLSASYNITF